jgi:hypothetical protein
MDGGPPGEFIPDDYTAWVAYPYAQIRVEIGTERGDVRWFLAQLEYNVEHEPYGDDDRRQVARFDYHPRAEWGHDVPRNASTSMSTTRVANETSSAGSRTCR